MHKNIVRPKTQNGCTAANTLQIEYEQLKEKIQQTTNNLPQRT